MRITADTSESPNKRPVFPRSDQSMKDVSQVEPETFTPNPATLESFITMSDSEKEQALDSFFTSTPINKMSTEDLYEAIKSFQVKRRAAANLKKTKTRRQRDEQSTELATGVRGPGMRKIVNAGDATALADYTNNLVRENLRKAGMSEEAIEAQMLVIKQAQGGNS